jgi:O-antigen/teichoic acid export membrane protein
MVIAIFAQQIVYTLISHLVATRRWQVKWDWNRTGEALRFGIPLLGNGALIFAIHNGDSMLTGSFLGMETLGWFYVVIVISLTPSLLLDKTVMSICMPILSQSLQDREAFVSRAISTLQLCFASSIVIAASLTLFGPAAIILLFGQKFEPALAVVVQLAAINALKSLKIGPSTIAIATARTHLPMIANIPRAIGLGIAAYLLSQGGGINDLILVALIGEALGVILAYGLLLRYEGRDLVPPTAIYFWMTVICIGLILVYRQSIIPGADLLANLNWLLGLIALLCPIVIVTMPVFRRGIV